VGRNSGRSHRDSRPKRLIELVLGIGVYQCTSGGTLQESDLRDMNDRKRTVQSGHRKKDSQVKPV